MKKKKWVILAAVIAAVAVLVLAFGGRERTLYDDPEDMAEGAVKCLYGWRDMELVMALTPYREGTEIYDIAYDYFADMMCVPRWSDTFRLAGNMELKKADPKFYREIKDTMGEFGITEIRGVRCYYFVNDSYEELAVYVAQIEGKWYLVMAE